ncbi:rCG51686, isoform CRA_b [Rattus norvegicus]|nr:rCG51686, isoform CRA_b [Rattus norvegicus]
MSPPQKNVKDQRFFPFRRGHARPAEVNRRQPRDCKGRDVWLEVNGNYKGSKADSERYQDSFPSTQQ